MVKRFVRYHPINKNIFYYELRREVNLYLNMHTPKGRAGPGMVLKIFFCLLLFVFTYSQYLNPAYSFPEWLAICLLLGFSSMLVGVNIGHDGVHEALFQQKPLNYLAGLAFDLIGISSYSWKLKHNIIHHRFPNITGVDFDIEAAPLLRLSPKDKWYPFHRYQHVYAPIIYTLFSLNLVVFNDIYLLYKIKREDIDGKKHPRLIRVRVICSKLFYLTYMLIIPILVLSFPWWKVVIGFLFMHGVLSLLMAFILLPSHLFEQTSFNTPDGSGAVPEDWAIHQMRTTLDFSANSTVLNFLFGGFNTNVIHHLFPRVCHFYFRPLSVILRKKALEFDVAYNHTTLFSAIISHFKILKQLGRKVL